MEVETNQNIEPEIQEKGYKKYLEFAWELFKIAVIAFVIVAPIRYFLFQPFIVSGESMVPSFQNGDYLIVDEISYRFSNPERGDVVVFDTNFIPNYYGQRFIKRVIGLPGEVVNVTGGHIEVTKDNKTITLSEKYLPASLKTVGEVKKTLGKDEFFVLGDNRDYSYDSRVWGVVPRKDIIGKAFLRLFPINALAGISKPAY
jgi:signal peptidase I